jgi:hypothetical protein
MVVAEQPQHSNGNSGDRPDEFHSRPLTRGGGRNMQDSTFAFSGKSFSGKSLDSDQNSKSNLVGSRLKKGSRSGRFL